MLVHVLLFFGSGYTVEHMTIQSMTSSHTWPRGNVTVTYSSTYTQLTAAIHFITRMWQPVRRILSRLTYPDTHHVTTHVYSRPASMAVRFVDIGANLTDGMFRGEYHTKQRHAPDIAHVVARARAAGISRCLGGCVSCPLARDRSTGVTHMVITGTALEDNVAAIALAREYGGSHLVPCASVGAMCVA